MAESGEVDGAGGVEGFLWGADREAGAQDGVLVAVVGGGVDREVEAYRFRRQFYYAASAILLSNPASYSTGDRYPSSF